MIDITVLGASGRMGKAIISCISKSTDCRLVGAVSEDNDPNIGKDIGEILGLAKKLGISLVDNDDVILKNTDVVIDFTLPSALDKNLILCSKGLVPMIIGVTGLDEAQLNLITETSFKIPILYERNMSVGVNVLLNMVQNLSKILDSDFDTEITETHHRHKIDSPSGTAIAIGEAIAKAKNLNFSDIYKPSRINTNTPRSPNSIGISSIRGGGFIGDHTVSFTSEDESIEISHHALDRKCFAQGALSAAKWIADQDPGLYSMNDVLGLK